MDGGDGGDAGSGTEYEYETYPNTDGSTTEDSIITDPTPETTQPPPAPTQPPTEEDETGGSDLIPQEIFSLLPIILQLIIPLIQSNNNNANVPPPPPATAAPPPLPQPQLHQTDRPHHHHHHHHLQQLPYPSSGLFSFPFDYSGFYNSFLPFYDYSVFSDPFFPPFRTHSQASPAGHGKPKPRTDQKTGLRKKKKKRKKLKLFRTLPQKTVKDKPQVSRSRKSKKKTIPRRKKKKNPRKQKEEKRKKKREKSRRRIAFRKRLRVPGGGDLVTVSTPDLTRGIQISYHGKSYKLSIPQLFNYFNRKKSKIY